MCGEGGNAENLVLLGEYESVLLGCNGPKEVVGGGDGEGDSDCLIDGIITSLVSGDDDAEKRDFGGVLFE